MINRISQLNTNSDVSSLIRLEYEGIRIHMTGVIQG